MRITDFLILLVLGLISALSLSFLELLYTAFSNLPELLTWYKSILAGEHEAPIVLIPTQRTAQMFAITWAAFSLVLLMLTVLMSFTRGKED